MAWWNYLLLVVAAYFKIKNQQAIIRIERNSSPHPLQKAGFYCDDSEIEHGTTYQYSSKCSNKFIRTG